MKLVLQVLFLLNAFLGISQKIENPSLNGTIGSIPSSGVLPDWELVPAADPVSQASPFSVPFRDTPDVCDENGPQVWSGIVGYPLVGKTFVSGAFSGTDPNLFQEGIMQEIFNLNVGQDYTVEFYQCVVKQGNNIDTSGCWGVYLDGVFFGKTKKTVSYKDYDDPDLDWEFRTIVFTATKNSHWLKFLPLDDDFDQWSGSAAGGLRMGIDDIRLSCQMEFDLPSFEEAQDSYLLILDSLNADVFLLNGVEQESSQFEIVESGKYFVEVHKENCVVSDSIEVLIVKSPEDSLNNNKIEVLYPNVLIVSGINEEFKPIKFTEDEITSFHLSIFNRWGNKVFSTNSFTMYWDGLSSGGMSPSGTYFWFVEYTTADQIKHTKNGFVQLISQ